MNSSIFPKVIVNWINGQEVPSDNSRLFANLNPHNAEVLCQVSLSTSNAVDAAITSAQQAQAEWSNIPAVRRGQILYDVCNVMHAQRNLIGQIVALETGKSLKAALGETDGAIALGRFFAGEGQRLHGRTLQSDVPHKTGMTIREPVGIAGLIVPANTPIANIAWKVFPALICGNAAILKASEDAPGTAWIFGKIVQETGLPPGVLNILQGMGVDVGEPLVKHPQVGVISFTGSTQVGRRIATIAGERLAKISLELGGKNPLIVCDDADLENALRWSILSAFSNAGQRCASASRIIVFDSIYERFEKMLVDATAKLRLGIDDNDNLGPVINEKQLKNMLMWIDKARSQGARIVTGGKRVESENLGNGYYMSPTILDNVSSDDEISHQELFGPITILYRVHNYEDALKLANNSKYGLTACIHTNNIHRALHFTKNIQAGLAIVNGGTFGSEPHMPFGGIKNSGNGTREPGIEALDVYSEIKAVYLNILPELAH
ncbi:MAG: aldehyde dehydrogenase [SAR324 cluster bacterium]|nr:aldehyde dehydrogenase [SAR324 cluster bacterium]